MDGAVRTLRHRMRRIAAGLRRGILKAPPLRQLRRSTLARLGQSLREAPDPIVATLATAGIWQGTDGTRLLGNDHLPRLFAAAQDLAASATATQLDGEALWQRFPWVYRLGLVAPLLDLAEDYLGTPCLYLGATLKREASDGMATGQRQWHRDVEDERMLRVLVYLSDVGQGDGPFEYVPADVPDAGGTRRYSSGYLADAAMAALASPATWRSLYGATGSVIVFDGARLFHRAQPPQGRDRLSVTFVYTSRWPLELRSSSRLTAASRRQLDVGPRALACVPPARTF